MSSFSQQRLTLANVLTIQHIEAQPNACTNTKATSLRQTEFGCSFLQHQV